MGLRTEARPPSPKSQSQVEAPLEVSVNCTCCFWAGVCGKSANEAARPPGGFSGGEVAVGVAAGIGVRVAVGVAVGGVRVAVGVGVFVEVGVGGGGVRVAVAVSVRVAVGVGGGGVQVAVGVAVRVGVRVTVGVNVEAGVGVTVGATPKVGVGVGVPEVVAGDRYAPTSHHWPALYWSPVRTLLGHDEPGRRAVLQDGPTSAPASMQGELD